MFAKIVRWGIAAVLGLYALLRLATDLIGIADLFDDPGKPLGLAERAANWLFQTPWWVPAGLLIIWTVVALMLTSRQRLERPAEPTALAPSTAAPSSSGYRPVHEAIAHVAQFLSEPRSKDFWPLARSTIRQAALDGRVVLRGRKQMGLQPRKFSDVETVVPPDYWQQWTLNPLATDAAHKDDLDTHTAPQTGDHWSQEPHYAMLKINYPQVLALWSQGVACNLVPLKDAVKELYDKARNSIVIGMTPVTNSSEDERLTWLAVLLWGKIPLQVRLLISNKFEPLPHTVQRGRRITFKDGEPLLISPDRRTNEEHIEAREVSVLRSDLDRAIEIFKAQP